MEQTPPAMPQARSPDWWDRNWKWFLTVLVLGVTAIVTAFFGAIFLLAFGSVKRSDAYKLSMALAEKSPALVAEIGEPIEPGWFVSGNFHYSGSSGDADLSIPISGPKGEARLYILALRELGEWRLTDAIAEINESGERLDLLE